MSEREQIIASSNKTLDEKIRTGADDAVAAFIELNGRALGGNPGAQERIRRLDNDIKLGEVAMPKQKIKKSNAGHLPPDRDPQTF